MMAEVRATTQEQATAVADGSISTPAMVVAPPSAATHRRPRVREVSSRFMSPVASSFCSSSGDLHLLASKSPLPKQHGQRSSSVQRQRRNLDPEPLCCADENRLTETTRSLETPFQLPLGSQSQCGKAAVVTSSSSTTTTTTTTTTTQKKHQQRAAVMKLFKENGGRAEHQQQSKTYSDNNKLSGRCGNNNAFTQLRPDTPTVTSVDRVAMASSSRLRLLQRSTSITAAAKLLQSSGMSSSVNPSNPLRGTSFQESASISINSTSVADDHSNGNSLQNCTTRSLPELRSSMPEADMLPTVSSRLLVERNNNRSNGNIGDSSKFSASPCSRSLNLPLSTCEPSLFHSIKSSDKTVSALSKPHTTSMKMGALCLPPVPPYAKLGTDAKKGKKVSSHQEDVHTLRLLHNHYLQWRYANAKAEASMQAQKRETERTLYSLGIKISDLYDSVKRKRIELGLLQKTKSLSMILEAQMPHLDEWSTFEGDYSISLSEAIEALLNASVQVPLSGNVRADIRGVGEAMNSAIKLMEIIAFHVQSFMPKAEEMENLMLELAKVIGGERSLIEECGDLLTKTHTSQVEECSIRGQLIQLHRSCSGHPREE